MTEHTTRKIILCLDTDRTESMRSAGSRERDVRVMRNVRLVDAETMREIGSSGYGAWSSMSDAVQRLFAYDSIEREIDQ